MTIGEAFKNAYNGGLEVFVSFVKNNGEEREMTVKRDPILESQCVKGRSFIGPNQLHVVELAASGKQWRTVNLNKINYFTINNRYAGSF